uniref:Uncharacterized protein n=1 Tax=Latimeria chalumnae TaxID=7897 RepID=H3AUU2_LATCH
LFTGWKVRRFYKAMDLHEVLKKGDFYLIRKLTEHGADVNITDGEGRTPLMICCLHDSENWALGSARILLSYGAKVGYCDKMGRSALIYAVIYGREALLKLFLDAMDYDLNHSDKEGCTALWYAAASGNTAVTKMLILHLKKYGMQVDKANKKGFTPLMQACRLGHASCANLLRHLGKASDQVTDKLHSKTAKEWEL